MGATDAVNLFDPRRKVGPTQVLRPAHCDVIPKIKEGTKPVTTEYCGDIQEFVYDPGNRKAIE
jgi:hypothetical protein